MVDEVERQDVAHPVIAEALPHLCGEQAFQLSWMVKPRADAGRILVTDVGRARFLNCGCIDHAFSLPRVAGTPQGQFIARSQVFMEPPPPLHPPPLVTTGHPSCCSAPVPDHKIPVWEQELSCGAAGMNRLLAAHALGFVAGWVTGWRAYSERVRSAFGAQGERIAGFIFIGHASRDLEDRERPDPSAVRKPWQPPSI